VLTSEGETLQFRLLAVSATQRALAWGLDTLGIPAPERM
jgi:arginyl-tRNA synthetase